MKLKWYLWVAVCLIALTVSILPAYCQQFRKPNTGFQVSTLGALNVGVYEGDATLAKLKSHGDFGLGTLEGLDGELVVLNGKFYQIKADGVVYPVANNSKIPFSTVTFFHKERG